MLKVLSRMDAGRDDFKRLLRILSTVMKWQKAKLITPILTFPHQGGRDF